MQEKIKELFDSFEKEIPHLSKALIEISDFVKEENPDLVLIPLRGALPIETLLSYIYHKKGMSLPNFLYIHLSSREGVSNKTLNALKQRSNKTFNKVLLLDEVLSGLCWFIVFSPTSDDFFSYLNKYFDTEHLTLTGVTLENPELKRKREYLLEGLIKSFFKICKKYECEGVNKLIKVLEIKSDNLSYEEVNNFKNLVNGINSVEEYKNKLVDILIFLLSILSDSGINLEQELKKVGFSTFSDVINPIMELLEELDGLSVKEKSKSLKTIAEYIIKSNPRLFEIKERGCEFKLKLFEVPSIGFTDNPDFIGVGRDVKGGFMMEEDINLLRYYELSEENTPEGEYKKVTKQFYLIMMLSIDKELGVLNKREWFNKVGELDDKDFKKNMFSLIRKI